MKQTALLHCQAKVCCIAGFRLLKIKEFYMAEKKKSSGKNKNIAGSVRTLVADTVEKMGFLLWDVLYEKEGASWYLRIIIDRETGVDINDVEAVHRAIDPIIDEADPIEDFYYLEVSSPGVERELRLPEHYEAFLGELVTAKLFAAAEGVPAFAGMKEITAVLAAYNSENGEIILTEGENSITLAAKDVAKVNVYYDFTADTSQQDKE